MVVRLVTILMETSSFLRSLEPLTETSPKEMSSVWTMDEVSFFLSPWTLEALARIGMVATTAEETLAKQGVKHLIVAGELCKNHCFSYLFALDSFLTAVASAWSSSSPASRFFLSLPFSSEAVF